jgi:hypothetical protein
MKQRTKEIKRTGREGRVHEFEREIDGHGEGAPSIWTRRQSRRGWGRRSGREGGCQWLQDQRRERDALELEREGGSTHAHGGMVAGERSHREQRRQHGASGRASRGGETGEGGKSF